MKNSTRRLITVTALFCAIAGAPFRMLGVPTLCTNTVFSTLDSGPGSLRFALANATNGETITFCTNVTGTIHLTTGELVVSNSVTILGPGANVLAVSSVGPFRSFYVSSNTVVTIAGLAITSGITPPNPGPGSGIYNDHGTLTVSNCLLSGNLAMQGAGIYNDGRFGSNATLKVINSTLSGNVAQQSGGAIFNDGQFSSFSGTPSATAILINCTVSGNSAPASGGAILNIGEPPVSAGSINPLGQPLPGNALLAILNCTFSSNSSPGGSIVNQGVCEIGSTILNSNSIVSLFNPIPFSLGYNLSSDNGGGFLTKPTDQVNTDPLLGPLQLNGGPTPTQAPLCGSPAIDKGTNFARSATDQRGAPRTFDIPGIANAAGGDGTDIGAVESPIFAFTVLNTNDSGAGSLRQAIQDANASAGIDFIQFAQSAYGTITLTNGELVISDCLFLNGPGATNVAVDGNAASRVFRTTPSNLVTITGLTLTNGHGSPPGGGAIFNNHSMLTVDNCIIISNSAGEGGGIYSLGANSGQAALTLANSTITGNEATNGGGGGILNDAVSGHATLSVLDSTISQNHSTRQGGGLLTIGVEAGNATVDVLNSTISGNVSGDGGGGLMANGASGSTTVTIVNSTVSGNSAGFAGAIWSDGEQGASNVNLTILNSTISSNMANHITDGIFNDAANSGHATLTIGSTILAGPMGTNIHNDLGTVVSLGYNLSSDNGGGFLNHPSDKTNTSPLLGPLQLNGGQTPTHALMNGSPAIDMGTNFLGLAFDQRGPGFPRTAGGATDIGAFELENRPPVALCTNATVLAGSNCMATASINFGSYDPDPGDTIMLSQSPAGPYHLGTNIVKLTVTDNHGASNSCVGVVIVVDRTPPTIYCPTNIVTTNDTGQCSAVVNYTVTATDNCGSVTNITADIPSGSIFSVGTTNVHVTAVDDAGNTNMCSFTVTVLDTEAPLVFCRPAPNPSGKVFEPGKNSSAGSNPNGYYQLLAEDNCDPRQAISIYVYDTGSAFVFGPFHDADIVRVEHGSTPSSAPGSPPIVAVLRLVQDGLVYAQDTSGNVTPSAGDCLLPVSIK